MKSWTAGGAENFLENSAKPRDSYNNILSIIGQFFNVLWLTTSLNKSIINVGDN